ncbi:Scavenger receptor class B member 1 [Habropoda laboriosa]|uniref:Scavenger receptor class B member 1 n=2 Tax=Habropoda laboriosa TaxID=597456 RepID=A0A0L7QWT1_9HYME|nr:Scavenger receptor class B member 1 [Habropoda laboriosa]
MILVLLGIACFITAYVLHVLNPVKLIIEHKMQMAPNSLLFELWKKPPINVYLKVYIFNITNADEFLEGGEKLKVEEVGPYVYQEFLENQNVTWYDNDTISYIPKRTIVFVPEMSRGDPKVDLLNVPNIPMLGISSTLHDAGFFMNFAWTRLVNMLDSKPILNISVYEYLWGYEDNLVHLASGIVPSFINFRKFGLLDRMYDEGENIVHLNVGKNKNMTDEEGRYLSIESYNGSPGMSQWGYREVEGNETYPENTICNRVKGATEGELLPANLDKHAVFRVFRKAFCRAIPIVYKEEVITNNGLLGYLYRMPDDFLYTPDENPDNACFCKKKKKCLKKGLSDMTPCYYQIPAAMSLPHLLDSDPSLFEKIEGLNPDPKKHLSRIILEPTFGIPMNVNSRIQINLVMHHTTHNPRITIFNDMTLPVFWTDLVIKDLPSDMKLLLNLALHIGPIAQMVVIGLCAIGGVTMLVLAVLSMLWTVNQQQEIVTLDRRESCDLRIPLNYGQYTTIRILPAIKKITSKTDLFG